MGTEAVRGDPFKDLRSVVSLVSENFAWSKTTPELYLPSELHRQKQELQSEMDRTKPSWRNRLLVTLGMVLGFGLSRATKKDFFQNIALAAGAALGIREFYQREVRQDVKSELDKLTAISRIRDN